MQQKYLRPTLRRPVLASLLTVLSFGSITSLTAGITGCGGGGQSGFRPILYTTPSRAALAPLQEQEFVVGAVEVSLDASTIEWHVVEGDRGGTVRYATDPVEGDYGAYRARVIYTAPATTGTYHLRWQNEQKFNATAIIDVKNP